MTRQGPSADANAERREWVVEKLVPGGDGMTHLLDGRVGFVAGAFPGDVIRPLAVEARKGHVRATRFEIVTPSKDRVAPMCPVAAECGGCDFMALDATSQLSHKEGLLRAALERVGGFDLRATPVTMTAVGPALSYRGRVRFHVDSAGRIGFFARGSHALVVVPSCPVCAVEMDEALLVLRKAPRDALAAFSEIDVRRADIGPRVALRFVPRVAGGAAPAVRAVTRFLPGDWSVSVEGEEAPLALPQSFVLPGGATLRAAPGVFTQVNWPVNVALVEAVVAGARARRVTRFLDAYAGAGNFTLPFLAAGFRGVSVERDPQAVDCARAAARAAALPDDGFIVDDAAHALAALARKRERFDLVLLDPPRAGARDTLGSVIRLAPPSVAICACDPVTLARDLAVLARAGYALDAVHGFDMFPQTHHLEALSWMTRRSQGGAS